MKCKQKILVNFSKIQEANYKKMALDNDISIPKPEIIIEDFGFRLNEVYSYSVSINTKEIFIKMNNGDSHRLIYEKQIVDILDNFFSKNDPYLVNEIKITGN